MVEDPTLKTCISCQIAKPRADFARRKGSPDGTRNKCKLCDAAYQIAYKRKYAAKLKSLNAAYRETHKEENRLKRGVAQQWCVYRITFPDGCFYIGSTCNLGFRINMHRSLTKRGVNSPALNDRDFSVADVTADVYSGEIEAKQVEKNSVRKAKESDPTLCLNIKLPDNTGRAYWVYVIQSMQKRYGKSRKELPGFFYVGMTTDPARRLLEHNGIKGRGGKYTARHRPWIARSLFGPYSTRSEALKAEHALKRGHRGERRCRWTPEDSEWCRGEGANHPWVSDPTWKVPNRLTDRQAQSR